MNVINLKVGGKQIVGKMGVLAFRLYCDHHKIELEEIDQHITKRNLFGFTDLIYFAHCAACNIEGRPPEVSIHECTELIETENETFFEKIGEAVMDSRLMGKTLRERQGEQSKKKTAN